MAVQDPSNLMNHQLSEIPLVYPLVFAMPLVCPLLQKIHLIILIMQAKNTRTEGEV